MVVIEVCVGSGCHLKGAYNVIHEMENLIREKGLEEKAKVKTAFCIENCTHPVSVKIQDEVFSVTQETVENFFYEKVVNKL